MYNIKHPKYQITPPETLNMTNMEHICQSAIKTGDYISVVITTYSRKYFDCPDVNCEWRGIALENGKLKLNCDYTRHHFLNLDAEGISPVGKVLMIWDVGSSGIIEIRRQTSDI